MKKVVSEISGAVFSLPWLIAKDYGLFEAEGIDMEFVRTLPSSGDVHTENPGEVNPILQHTAFEEARDTLASFEEEISALAVGAGNLHVFVQYRRGEDTQEYPTGVSLRQETPVRVAGRDPGCGWPRSSS